MFSFLKKPPEVAFWKWFLANEDRLFHFEREQEKIFDELSTAIKRVDDNLCFEFSSIVDGVREFVISANGIKRAIPAVNQVANAAPSLPRWAFTRFRPRRSSDDSFVIGMNDLKISSKDVFCQVAPDGEKLALRLLIPGYREDDRGRFGGIGFIMLDTYLGEYDVMTKVGGVDFAPMPAATDNTMIPLQRLPQHFDDIYQHVILKD